MRLATESYGISSSSNKETGGQEKTQPSGFGITGSK